MWEPDKGQERRGVRKEGVGRAREAMEDEEDGVARLFLH